MFTHNQARNFLCVVPLQSLNDTDKQFMNIGPNYLSCISSQQQTS